MSDIPVATRPGIGDSSSESQGTIALRVAYDGACFSGFAKQKGDVATVQGGLERALSTILRRDVDIVGAGRTDSGVHALGQVVSFAARGDEPEGRALARSVNALAGPGVVVRDVFDAPAGFSARFDAEAREYRYRIAPGSTQPLFLARIAWHVAAPLDLEAMAAGAAHLVGEHDFRSFCVAESAEGQRTFRNVRSIEVSAAVELGEPVITIRVVGNAFLHSMVRVIVGTLVEVGAGRRDAGWVAAALEAHDRSAAGPTAPAQGLTFWQVRYPAGMLTRRP